LEFLHLDGPAGVTGPLHLSASSLNDYHECPRRYYYKYVVHIPEAVSFEARLGTAIHRALELFHQQHQRVHLGLLPELLERFEMEVRKVAFQNESEREQGLARGQQILTQYLTKEADRSASIRRMEVEKEFSLALGPDLTLCGKIDRLDWLDNGRVRIVDYKTGELKSRPDYLEGFQMPTYAWAVMEALNREPESVEVIGLKKLKQTAKGVCIDCQELPWDDDSKYALTPARLEELKTQITAIVQGIRAGNFAAAPDEQRCGWCAYRLLCDQAWGSTE
jgi:ATP-dependent helicase/DNAse subunit B